MINSIEEAQKHSLHITGRSDVKNVVVLQDGTIYHGGDECQNIVDSMDCFVVKGDLVKKIKVKKQKETTIE